MLSPQDVAVTAQKMKFSIKDFFSKWDQIRSFLRIWPHLLKKSLMENFIFSAVSVEGDISVDSQKQLKRDDFFVTSLRRLEHISKKISIL